MKLFLLLIFTICNASVAFVGKVLDVYSNPIKDVNIEIESLSIGAITDSDGLFLLPSLELEEYILNLSDLNTTSFSSIILFLFKKLPFSACIVIISFALFIVNFGLSISKELLPIVSNSIFVFNKMSFFKKKKIKLAIVKKIRKIKIKLLFN